MCTDIDYQIEEGLCHCGCGEWAPLAKKTAKKYGHVKGGPVRYINWHYQRTKRLSPVDYVVDEATGCWVWQRGRVVGGYGEMRDGGIMRRAHRVYYERFRGPIPPGLHLDHLYYEMYRGPVPEGVMVDHLCRNHACVNPYHLEPVTAKENAARRDRAKGKRALRVLR
jgi:HNH endonuclease